MNDPSAEVSPRFVAKVAGFGYLAIFVLAIFANFFVVTRLIVSGDPAATAANIRGSEALFRSGLVAFLFVFALDVAIAWALYVFFRPVSRDLSLLAAWFRLVYTVLLGVALIFQFLALELVRGTAELSALDPGSRDAQAMLFLDGFDFGWLIGLLCFGLHLILLGHLVVRSAAMPKTLGILLAVAGAAYVMDTVAHTVLANYQAYANLFLAIVAVPSLVGEMAFALWLLARGGKVGIRSTLTRDDGRVDHESRDPSQPSASTKHEA